MFESVLELLDMGWDGRAGQSKFEEEGFNIEHPPDVDKCSANRDADSGAGAR